MSNSKEGAHSNSTAHDERGTAAASHPRMSVENAKAALSNFTLSQRSKRPSTRNYLKEPGKVALEQREAIKKQFETTTASSGPGMTIITATRVATEMLQEMIIDLKDLLSALDKARGGTQFYTAGSALTEKIQIQKTIDAFFKDLTGGGNGQ
ncbi:hypothetical protein BN2475_1400002 [Paraburkholderia ribeironis]|uniref:Uncharacterized protein n=1 Tax=Paraburkholderia ribeironis TaxID=1247936 RepID=A0A1N7SPU6_9BURK|nr:hypothetical protein [Paraburkholderia ribeironis]SIT49454.1 hypothetical protein BN2475_1400002 [Paraburkholderia ribeironis]